MCNPGWIMRLGWSRRGVEASIYGRDLADDQDPEFGSGPKREEVPRSVGAKLAYRL